MQSNGTWKLCPSISLNLPTASSREEILLVEGEGASDICISVDGPVEVSVERKAEEVRRHSVGVGSKPFTGCSLERALV